MDKSTPSSSNIQDRRGRFKVKNGEVQIEMKLEEMKEDAERASKVRKQRSEGLYSYDPDVKGFRKIDPPNPMSEALGIKGIPDAPPATGPSKAQYAVGAGSRTLLDVINEQSGVRPAGLQSGGTQPSDKASFIQTLEAAQISPQIRQEEEKRQLMQAFESVTTSTSPSFGSSPVGLVDETRSYPGPATDPVFSSGMGLAPDAWKTPVPVNPKDFVKPGATLESNWFQRNLLGMPDRYADPGVQFVPLGAETGSMAMIPNMDWSAYRAARRPDKPEMPLGLSLVNPQSWIGESAEHPDVLKADLESDDVFAQLSAVDAIAGDAAAAALVFGRGGQALFKSALSLGAGLLKVPFTVSSKAMQGTGTVLRSGPIAPYTEGAEKMLANLWDDVIMTPSFKAGPLVGRSAIGGVVGAANELRKDEEDSNPLAGAAIGATVGALIGPGIKRRWVPTYEKTFKLEGETLVQGSREKLMKSPQEIFQSGVERLNKTTAMKFRQAAASKALTTSVGKELGKEMQGLDPVSRFEVVKGLRGVDPATLTSDSARRTLENFEQRLTDAKLSGPYEIEFRERLGKLLNRPFEAPEEIFANPEAEKWVKELNDNLHLLAGDTRAERKFNTKKVHDTLVKMIEDPAVDKQWSVLARDLLDIPATMPQHVANASKDATNAYITESLYKGKSIIRLTPKPGEEAEYLKTHWRPFISKANEGVPRDRQTPVYVKRDVELELRALQDIPKISHSIWNQYFMSPWKMGKTIMRPAANVRNFFSNAILNDWGGLSPLRMDIYYKAARDMYDRGKYTKRFGVQTGSGGTFSVDDISRLEQGMRYKSNMLDAGLSRMERFVEPMATVYNANERLFKIAKFIHNVEEKGMKDPEAALDAMKWTFNYGEITRATATMRSTVAPFFTWQAKVIPMMAETAVKHPVRFWKWLAFYQGMQNHAISSVDMSDEEFKNLEKQLPEYVQRGQFLLMPWRDEQDRLHQLNLTYMMPGYGDLNEWSGDFWKSMIGTPYVTIGSALLSNTKFSGAPISYDWEPKKVQYAKKAAYIWEQLAPSYMYLPVPGGTDYNTIMRTFDNDPEAPSWMHTAAAQVGLKVTPVDIPSALRRSEAMKHIHQSEIEMSMKKEIRKATTPEQVQDIVAKYSEYRRKYFTPGADDED